MLEKLQDHFIEKLIKNGLKENTLKNYRTDLRRFNTFLHKTQQNTKIEKISLSYILEYGLYLENHYSSNNSRRRKIQSLRIFFDYLVSKGIFAENFVRSIPTSAKFLDIPRPATPLNIRTIVDEIYKNLNLQTNSLARCCSLRNLILIHIIYGAGLKVSEIAPLNLEHILLEPKEKKCRVLINLRADRLRTSPLSSNFFDIFIRYKKALQYEQKKINLKFDELLFNSNPHRILSGGISARGIELIFKNYSDDLKIKITPKSLRQSCILKWIQRDVKDTTIKERVGVAPDYSLELFHRHKLHHLYQSSLPSPLNPMKL